MNPLIPKPEYRTREHCDKIHTAKANTAKWIAGIVLAISLSGVGIWARTSMINTAAETKQEVSIGQLQTENKSTIVRLERIENKLDQAISMMHKSTTP